MYAARKCVISQVTFRGCVICCGRDSWCIVRLCVSPGCVVRGRNSYFRDTRSRQASRCLLRAQLQAASFKGSELQGAVLNFAQLQGAQLQGAQLQGALLNFAQLQGAQLQGAQLQNALLLGAFTWRADIRQAGKRGARVVDPKVGAQQPCPKPDSTDKPCDWSAESYRTLKLMLLNPIPPSITELDPSGGLPPEDEGEIAKTWTDIRDSPPTLEGFEKGLAEQWRETGCVAEGAPYALLAACRTRSPLDR